MATSPTVLKWWIALELTRLREQAGVTRQQVADHLRSSLATVRNAENARNFPRPLELREMLTLYGVPERSEQFLELLTSAKKGRDWFEAFAETAPEWFNLFLGLESSAGRISSYDALLVPGLFQTDEYAEAVIRRAAVPELTDQEVAHRVELRLARQELLSRNTELPTIWSVLDESALHGFDDRPEVMRRQLQHLSKVADYPNVTIQILPMNTRPHPGSNGTFTVLDFPDLVGSPTVAYEDGMVRGSYHENSDAVLRYRNALTRLQVMACKPAESRQRIADRAQELS